MSETQQQTNIELKVADGTDLQKLAWAIKCEHIEGKRVSLKAVGAGAVNTAVKSIAIANGLLAQEGFILCAIPHFGSTPDTSKSDGRLTVITLDLHKVPVRP